MRSGAQGARALVVGAFVVCGAWLVFNEARIVLLGNQPIGILSSRWAHDAVLLASSGLCLARAAAGHSGGRWDGAGCPDGLTGDEIPLGARIIAVADAFATLVAPQPYRAPVSPERAVEAIRRRAGTQFDAAAVAALPHALADPGLAPPSRHGEDAPSDDDGDQGEGDAASGCRWPEHQL